MRTKKTFELPGGGPYEQFEDPQECLVRDLAKIFLTSKFSYLLFRKPTYKSENGTANMRWLLTNSKPPGPINMVQ
jgi:hypothetical protein